MEIKRHTTEDGISLAVAEIPAPVDLEGSDSFGLYHDAGDVKSASRRAEIIVTGLLVKELFGGECRLAHEPSGAPFLERDGVRVGPEISISHCRGAVAVAYRDNARVGVDIELARERVMRVRERVLSDEELRFTGLSVWKNTLAWTAKEALFKCVPESGVDFKADLSLDLRAVEDGAARSEYTAVAYGRNYRVVSLSDGERIVTLACQF